MSAARLAAAALLAGAAALTMAPPARADSPTGAWTDPAPHTSANDIPLATLARTGPLAGYAEFDGGIAGVSFNLVEDADPEDPCTASDDVAPQAAPGGDRRVDFAFEAPFPCNRRYQVRATVTPQQRDPLEQHTPLVLNLLVDVALPPAPVADVHAEASGRSVVVRWEAVEQAPDFEGYQIRRAGETGRFDPIGEVAAHELSFVDDTVPDTGGVFRYRVHGMRPGPEPGTTIYADAGDTAAVEVTPVPTDEEEVGGDGDGTTVAPGGDGGSVRPGSNDPVRRTFRTPTRTRPRWTTATTLDTGFAEALPFDAPGSPEAAPVTPPPGDPAVVARFDDDAGDDDQRQTLLLVAGGSVAFSWAMLLRFVNRRALVL